jgi:DUF4097 and DUF4098 domain-containing protein YvlB
MSKKFIVIIVCVLVVLTGFLISNEYNKKFNQTYQFKTGNLLKVKTYKGSLHIKPWDKSIVRVEAVIVAPEGINSSYARKIVDATNIEVRERAGRLFVRADYDDVPRRVIGKTLPYVHLTIRTPRELNLDIDDYKSELNLGSFKGDLKLKTYKGKVHLKELTGDLDLDSYKGEGEINIKKGRVAVDSYKGNFKVNLKQILGNCEIDTYKGTIDLQLSRNQAATVVRKKNKKGSIDVNLREGGDYKITVSTYKGTVKIRN